VSTEVSEAAIADAPHRLPPCPGGIARKHGHAIKYVRRLRAVRASFRGNCGPFRMVVV
jgi:hypothetical protein